MNRKRKPSSDMVDLEAQEEEDDMVPKVRLPGEESAPRSMSMSNQDIDDAAESVTIKRLPLPASAWAFSKPPVPSPPETEGETADDSETDDFEDDSIDISDEDRFERQLARESRIAEKKRKLEETAAKESDRARRIAALAERATGEFMDINDGISGTQTFCYLCYTAAQEDNPYRNEIKETLRRVGNMDERCAFTMIAKFYAFHLESLIGHQWTAASIREHAYYHDPDTRILITDNIRSMVAYSEMIKKRAYRVDESGEEMDPDTKQMMGHMMIMKSLEFSLAKRDKMTISKAS